MPSSANTIVRLAFPLLLERFVSRTSFGEHVACLRYPLDPDQTVQTERDALMPRLGYPEGDWAGADDRSRSCEETTCWSWSLRCLPYARHSVPHLLHIRSSGIETPFYNVMGSRSGPQLRLHPPDFLFRFIDTTGSDGRSIGGRIAADFSASKDVRESGDRLRKVGWGALRSTTTTRPTTPTRRAWWGSQHRTREQRYPYVGVVRRDGRGTGQGAVDEKLHDAVSPSK